MDANSNSDLAQDSEVVDDEPTVPVSFPDDTHDVSRKASVLDPEKRRRLEEEDEEDDKNSDRHRRKKKKSKDRDREHKDKDKDKDRDRDGKKRDHKDRDKDKERDRGSGRDRSERDRDRDKDHEADRLKRKTKGDDVERTEDDASRKRADSADSAPNGKDKDRASSSSARTSNGDSLAEVDPADKTAKRDKDCHRDTEKESKRSDRASEKDKDRDGESKDKDSKEKEKERKSRRSRSRSPARRETDDRDRRDRDRERSRERNDRRARERERDRARERDRERDDRKRDRGGSYRRRERSRSRSAEKRRADRDKEREERSEKEKKDKADGVKRITLKDILTANPGISMPDAVQRLNVYNTAAAMSTGPLDPSVASTALSGPSNGVSGGMEMYYGGHPVDPNTAAMAAAQAVAALNAQVVGAGGPFGVIGAGGAITKPHREVYIGNLPPGVTVSQLADFLNVALKQLGVAKEGGSVVSCWVSGDGHYGFAELRTVEECNAALAYLNGVQIGINLIKVGRPKGYLGPTGIPPMIPGFVPPAGLLGGMMNPLTGMMGLPQPPNPMMANMGGLGMGGLGMGMGMVGGMPVVSHSNVVMVSNLPMGIKDDEVRELVSPFGTLTAFNSIKTSSGTSQAAVFEYEDSAAADSAVSGLDKLEIGEHKLSVQRVPPHAAPLLLQPSINPTPPARPPPPAAKDRLQDLPPTCVIRLSNMTTPQELASDDECMELQEDVAEECNVYGVVLSVVIPRGNGDDGEPRGEEVGMVYVHFTHSEGAAKAKGAIAGRMFNGNIVKATFFPEDLFLQQVYLLPENYKIPTDEEESDIVGDVESDVVVVQNGGSEHVGDKDQCGNVADMNTALAVPLPAVVMPTDDAMD